MQLAEYHKRKGEVVGCEEHTFIVDVSPDVALFDWLRFWFKVWKTRFAPVSDDEFDAWIERREAR